MDPNSTETLDRYVRMYFSSANSENTEQIQNYFGQTTQTDIVKELQSIEENEQKFIPGVDPKQNDSDFYKNYLCVYMEQFMASEKNDLTYNPPKKKEKLKPPIVSKIRNNWAKLPISDFRGEIVSTIRSNQITIVKGFTGCGKSTQIPQYIANDCFSRDILYNIVITQPRRFAAKALAERTAHEFDCAVGDLVGYQIGLDKKKDSNCTRILYCTTGVLLQRFIGSNCNHFTHIILDEIHERSADLDMLFLILKKNLLDRKLNSKIILMSATFDTDLFQHYYTLPKFFPTLNTFCDLSPAIFDINNCNVDKSKGYTKEIFYFEDIVAKLNLSSKFNYCVDFSKYMQGRETDYDEFLHHNTEDNLIFDLSYPFLHKALVNVVFEILFHGIEICQVENQTKGTILIFLPGLSEILSLLDLLKNSSIALNYKWKFFILHSTVSLKEQYTVMQTPVDNSRHIILATNIAESALTVPNVEFVIDFCLCKTLSYNRNCNNVTHLSLEWASKSSCEQRAGRTGRTICGQVYRLIPRKFYDTLFDYEVPEFEKIPLENYILKAKLIDPTLQPKKVFAFALNQPRLSDIQQSILTLKRTGALSVHIKPKSRYRSEVIEYRYDEEDGDLTTLGYIMSFLPLDIVLSKLIALGLVFDVTFETIVIAASHCTAGLFIKNSTNPLHNYKTRISWSNRSLSDSLTYLKVYRMFKTLEPKFHSNRSSTQAWCSANDIEYQRLCELETLIQEIIIRLRNSLKIDLNFHRNHIQKHSDRDLILKVVIAGAFYPNYFIRQLSKENDIKRYESSINFENTVILSGFDTDSITTTLYIPYLKELFSRCSNKIDFVVEGSRVYMSFDSENNNLSTNDEDHPLHKAYSTHLDSFKANTSNSNCSTSYVGLRDTNINTSVYVALAFRRLYRKQFTIIRFLPKVERVCHDNLLNSIQKSNPKSQPIEKNSFITKICHTPKKYLLPRMPSISPSCSQITLQISNFICPRLFFAVYDHIYVTQMLHNIELLSSCYVEKFAPKTNVTVDDFCAGELVLAPLSIDLFDSMTSLVNTYKLDKFTVDKYSYIWARAQILKVNSNNYRSTLTLYFVDFGLTDNVLIHKIYKLNCHFKFEVIEPLREFLLAEDLTSTRKIFDHLFSIPALAIKCELVRIRPISRVESVGNWLPNVNEFVVNYAYKFDFLFTAKIYAYLNDRLYVELYPLSPTQGRSKTTNSTQIVESNNLTNISLNELLVDNDLAELKIDSIICEHYNTRCNYNKFKEASNDDDSKLIFDADTLSRSEYQIDLKELEHNVEHYTGNNNMIRVRGPTSPLEVDFKGMTKNHLNKTVKVSQNSVNIITLESDVKAKHSRLLVAGEISMNESKTVYSLCNTTLMPNILDFPSFMCLLFAPFVELHVNKLIFDKCYGLPEEICGAICGIGFDPDTNSSYDESGDVDFYFDSSVSLEDIELINLLRYQISQFFNVKSQHIDKSFNCYNEAKMNIMYNLEHNLQQRQNKCRDLLFKLLSRERIKRRWFYDQQSASFPPFQWGFFNYEIIPPNQTKRTNYQKKFEFQEFSNSMLKTLDLKGAVLPPFFIPILNETNSFTAWEDDIMNNIKNLEEENYNRCFDQVTNLYLCKLCMYYDFSHISLQSHACNYDKGEHKEASYIFKHHYSIWKQQIEENKKFTKEIIEDDLQITINVDEEELSSNLNTLKTRNDIVPTLLSLETADNTVDLSARQRMYDDVFKSPYSLENLKRSALTFIKETTNGTSDQNLASISSLNEYFDEDEILLIENFNLIK